MRPARCLRVLAQNPGFERQTMNSLEIKIAQWPELDGQWQTLVSQEFHADYIGIGEAYAGVHSVADKIAAMSAYEQEGLSVWAGWAGTRLAGLLAGKQTDSRLVLYDLFVGSDFRRQGMGRRLLECAMAGSGTREVAAEVNVQNPASQALFTALGFEKVLVSQWLVRRHS